MHLIVLVAIVAILPLALVLGSRPARHAMSWARLAAIGWLREAQEHDEHLKPDLGGRREHPRWQWAGGLRLRRRGESRTHRVRADDVSKGGICVQSKVALVEDDLVELNKAGEDEWVPARVIHAMELEHDAGMFWIGLEFVRADITEEVLAADACSGCA